MPDAENRSVSLEQVQAAIQETSAGWVAGDTALTALSYDEQVLRLGVVPRPNDPSQEEQIRMAERSGPSIEFAAAKSVNAPASFDHRNINGQNYVTPVKDQGGCGSCVAFGTVAVMESTFRRQRANPNLVIDLSEAHLFYCHGGSIGRTCANGWWPSGSDGALEKCKVLGLVDEATYPYAGGNKGCDALPADWQNRATRTTGTQTFSSTAQVKDWIATKGPVTGCFDVYQDFFSYKSGVYKHTTGALAGGHCVAIIGYDDAAGCWICKNSWGPGWGDQGFFKIAYGECRIESWFGPVGAIGIVETAWLNNQRVTGMWAIDGDRNAWAYLSDVGWRRIAFDNDNIFMNLTQQLATAKAANRPVNVYQQDAILKEVYVL